MGRTIPKLLAAAALAALLLPTIAACGPSPTASSVAPAGTLVVIVRDGPARVPFQPKVTRILRAGEQLAARLGHAVQIEVDGSLLPQDHDGAQDVLARLVENLARDIDLVAKEDPKALAFARASFERLVVRYSPAEAGERRGPWRRGAARLDAETRTVDVVRGETQWLALESGEVGGELLRAFEAGEEDRFARVLPDALPRESRRAWFTWHQRGRRSRAEREEAPYARVGNVDARRVRGMVMLADLARRDGDADLARDVRAWLVQAVDDFASIYHHERKTLASAPADAPIRVAEAAYMGWLRAELPRMTRDERGTIAAHLFVIDFAKPSGAADRFAADVFPGIDRMAFVLAAMDEWIADGHPPKAPERVAHPLYVETFCPRIEEPSERTRAPAGPRRLVEAGRCNGLFYRWAVADGTRENALAEAVLARNDLALASSVFEGARRGYHVDELASYLRFLRRFERHPALWSAGMSLLDEVVYRPDATLLDEMRRIWRTSTSPVQRANALFWFARHADGSYEPGKVWPDLLQGTIADGPTLTSFLARGPATFETTPAAWPALAKDGGRVRAVVAAARTLLDVKEAPRAGRGGVVATLADVARLLCAEHALGELAELRAFAQAELPARPGRGLSDVVAAAEPSACGKPRPPVTRPKRSPPPPRAPGDAPAKPDLPEDER